MRTTINLPDDLFRAAKQAAAASDRTFTALVEDALRAALAQGSKRRNGPPVRLPTAPGRPRAGVDLNDSAALLDLVEEGDAPL